MNLRPPLARRALALLALTLAPSACTNSADVKLLEVDATGQVFGVAYLDNNGNGGLDGLDKPLQNLNVILTATRGGTAIQSDRTDSTGAFRMIDVAVGTYLLSIDPTSLGDSLDVPGGGAQVTLLRDSIARVDFGVSYPVLTFDAIRASEPGRRVFTSGIALNPRPNFSDGVVHLQAGDSIWLRTINVGRASISTGDSLRVLGRTKRDNGEMVLDDVTPLVLVNAATIPQPVEKGTGVAADAAGGRLDAALLRVRTAEILDTATVNGDFHFDIDDGTGALEVVLRAFLQLNPSAIRPDTILRVREVTGLLTPVQDVSGEVRWRLLPRGGSDLVLETKQADLSVTVEVDTTIAYKGDIVTFEVVVGNEGPHGASGIEVVDSVPTGFTLASATATRGTYTQATGRWALDTLAVGARDTLRLKATVTTDLVGTTLNQVRLRSPLKQVDPNINNNVAAVTVTITPPPAGMPERQPSMALGPFYSRTPGGL